LIIPVIPTTGSDDLSRWQSNEGFQQLWHYCIRAFIRYEVWSIFSTSVYFVINFHMLTGKVAKLPFKYLYNEFRRIGGS